MDNAVKHLYEFGPFELDPGQRLLRRGAARLDLPPRVFDTLVVLAESQGRLLEKDELMDRIWPDSVVEESNLTQAIYLLRKTLQDGEAGARFIETVPKRGYRFVASVRSIDARPSGSLVAAAEPVQSEAVPAAAATTVPTLAARDAGITASGRWIAPTLLLLALSVLAAALAARAFFRTKLAAGRSSAHAIAVLPLQNLSNDASQDYFADGFTEELVTDIAQIRSLRVISRTSTMTYKGTHKSLPEIARELHVDLVLEGSVVRDGNRVRVTAQLINAPTDTHLWAQTYESSVSNILDIQSQISRAIAEDIRLDLSPQEKERLAAVPTVDPEAHDLYLRASYQFGQQTADSIRQSLALYQAAVAKDPTFAMAYVGLAQAEAALVQITAESPETAIQHEKEALAKALEINPHLGDAHGLLASLAYYTDWDWPRAEREFQAALSEGARAPTEQRYGGALVTQGRFAEGNAHLQSALELDPLGKSPRVANFFGLYFQHRYSEARQKLEESLASSPDWLAGHGLMALLAATEHNCADAEKHTQWMLQKYPSPLTDFELSLVSSCHGDREQAHHYLEKAAAYKGPAFVSPYQLALGYSYAGDKETAISYLLKSADIREPQVPYIRFDPLFDPIRDDPRYVALERKVGLVP
ncbi:MAG: winged helix-turn-helix domain-containing protein [Terriglobales bacterium]|jgi:TolB-like protein/DNA-binding winged helix-turn-helix (wHTH) protein/Tfp pilus assembly protein PilF